MSDSNIRDRYVFSIRDLLVLITLCAIVLALLLPLLQSLRDRSRNRFCSNNFKQIALAIHNYHAAYGVMPSAMSGTNGNVGRVSGLVALTPFMEGQALWEQISNPLTVGPVDYPSMGPVPWDANYPPWKKQFNIIRCPDDSTKKKAFGLTNYVFCIGDSITNVHSTPSVNQVRGMFAPGHALRFADVTDGLSNTIAMMETANQKTNYVAGQFVINLSRGTITTPVDCGQFVDLKRPWMYSKNATLSDLGRGGVWADGAGGYALVHAILPPNSPCGAIGGTAPVDGVFSASSRHQGGCHVMMGDGAVIFITDLIDTGDLSLAAPTANDGLIISPYGVLGSLGTRASAEGDVGFLKQ